MPLPGLDLAQHLRTRVCLAARPRKAHVQPRRHATLPMLGGSACDGAVNPTGHPVSPRGRVGCAAHGCTACMDCKE
eukprot:365940-Chlamydomonas_euryale.AAC.9